MLVEPWKDFNTEMVFDKYLFECACDVLMFFFSTQAFAMVCLTCAGCRRYPAKSHLRHTSYYQVNTLRQSKKIRNYTNYLNCAFFLNYFLSYMKNPVIKVRSYSGGRY